METQISWPIFVCGPEDSAPISSMLIWPLGQFLQIKDCCKVCHGDMPTISGGVFCIVAKGFFCTSSGHPNARFSTRATPTLPASVKALLTHGQMHSPSIPNGIPMDSAWGACEIEP